MTISLYLGDTKKVEDSSSMAHWVGELLYLLTHLRVSSTDQEEVMK